jgi:hypothetical protein
VSIHGCSFVEWNHRAPEWGLSDDEVVVSVTASGIAKPQRYPLRVLADFACRIDHFVTPDVENS